ncbi:MAG TPA: hypothetical protein DCO90_10495 [Sphingobacterium sp.]|nr:hypothetical protein [Sphingobacterium sp.]
MDEQIMLPDEKEIKRPLIQFTEEIEEQRKTHTRKIRSLKNRLTILLIVMSLIIIIPFILGKKLTCEEMDAAPFYEKIHYYTRSPAFAHPCDSTSPFWSP